MISFFDIKIANLDQVDNSLTLVGVSGDDFYNIFVSGDSISGGNFIDLNPTSFKNNIKLYKETYDSKTGTYNYNQIPLNFGALNYPYTSNVIYDPSTDYNRDNTYLNYQIKILALELEQSTTYKVDLTNIEVSGVSGTNINYNSYTVTASSATNKMVIDTPEYLNLNYIHKVILYENGKETNLIEGIHYSIEEGYGSIKLLIPIFVNDIVTIITNQIKTLFFTTKIISLEALTDYSRISCNAYHKLNNIHKILDMDNVFNGVIEKNFNYQFSPINKNIETGEYKKTYNSITNEVYELPFDNRTKIEELYVKEYLPEFEEYFKDITNVDNIKFSSLMLSKNLNTTKTLMLKNVLLLNQYKGSFTGIKGILEIFKNNLGYQIVNVMQSPYKPFIYYITTDIPMNFWYNDIKPIVHPLGWKAVYNEIHTDLYFNYLEYPSTSNWSQWYKNRFLSRYIDYPMYITKSSDKALMSLSNNFDISSFHGIPIGDLSTHFKYQFAESIYEADTTTQIPGTTTPIATYSNYFDDITKSSGVVSNYYKKYYDDKTKDTILYFREKGLTESYTWYLNCNNHFHVAVGSDATGASISHSTNGKDWEPVDDSSSLLKNINSIYRERKIWLIAGEGVSGANNSFAYSNDGVNWAPIADSSNLLNICRYIMFDGTKFIACGRSADSISMIYSLNGRDWLPIKSSGVFKDCTKISYSPLQGKYVAIGIGSNNQDNLSFDGTNWLPLNDDYHSIAYSSDGFNWVPVPNSGKLFTSNEKRGCLYNNDKIWIAGGKKALSYSDSGAYSYDGVTWNTIPKSWDIFTLWTDIVYFNNQYIAIGWEKYGVYTTNNSLATSTDGINWTKTSQVLQSPNTIKFNGDFLVCGCIDGVYHSYDGVNWTKGYNPSNSLSNGCYDITIDTKKEYINTIETNGNYVYIPKNWNVDHFTVKFKSFDSLTYSSDNWSYIPVEYNSDLNQTIHKKFDLSSISNYN